MKAATLALLLRTVAAASVKPSDSDKTIAADSLIKESFPTLPAKFTFESAFFYSNADCTSDPINPFGLEDSDGKPVFDATKKANFGTGIHPVGKLGAPGPCSTNLLGDADATFACPKPGTLAVQEYELGSGCTVATTAPVVQNGACAGPLIPGKDIYVKVTFTGACAGA